MHILRDAFFTELHFDHKSRAPKFNFRSPNHAGRVKKGVNISPRHSTNPVIIPQQSGHEKRVRFKGRLLVLLAWSICLLSKVNSSL